MTGRSILRFVLWLLFLAACGWALLFGALIVFGADNDTRLGGLAFATGGGFVALAAWIALRRVPAAPKARAERESAQLPDDAEGEFSLRGTGRFGKKRVALRVGPDGFDLTIRGRTLHQAWDDVERFRVIETGGRYGGVVTVAYTLRGERTRAQRFARWITRFDRTLPTLETPPEQLVEVMEQYRQRYSLHA